MAVTTRLLHGIYTALVTPFQESSERIDESSLKKLIDWQLQAGVHGFVAGGSTGEASCLTLEEYGQLIRWTASGARGVPVIAGISMSSTARSVEAARVAQQAGAVGLLVAPPPYNKPSQEGIVRHMEAIGRASGLPIVAYNIPSRSAVEIQPATIGRLARDGIALGVKESSGSIETALAMLAQATPEFRIVSGEDALVWPMMACGAVGAISASANVAPHKFVSLYEAAKSGRGSDAARMQLDLLPFIRVLFLESNPVPAKAALHLLGIIGSPAVRMPLLPAGESTVGQLKKALEL